jgi:hypothetical protein
MMNISTLGEITRQHIPCPTHSLQRQLLILTNQGIHILQKLRPVDYLYRFLSQDDFSQSYCVRDFFALYGTIESACMCLGIACGLPSDAGGSRHLDPSVIGRHCTCLPAILCDRSLVSVTSSLSCLLSAYLWTLSNWCFMKCLLVLLPYLPQLLIIYT